MYKVKLVQTSPETKVADEINDFIYDKEIISIHFPSLTTAYIFYKV